jgi:hypothetical protein
VTVAEDLDLDFQLIIGRIATTFADEWVVGHHCSLSDSLQKKQVILTVVQSIDTIIAVMALVRFERRMTHHLKGHRSLFKLWTFKGIVFVQLVQSSIFSGLTKAEVFIPTAHVSYQDFAVGTPAFMLCCEVFLFSATFIWSYSSSPYRAALRQGAKREGSMVKGIIDTLNMIDILRGVWFMLASLRNFSSPPRYAEGRQSHQVGGKTGV